MASNHTSARRSHTKSRKGCTTCKRRKVRCDEFAPQCRNCTKRGLRCDYNDLQSEVALSSASAQGTSAIWSPEIMQEVTDWQRPGVSPFPVLLLPVLPSLEGLSTEDAYLLHHVCALSRDLTASNSSRFTTWIDHIPDFVSLATEYDYVLHALLGMTATHIASSMKSTVIDQQAIVHRGRTFKPLREAIGSLGAKNADAVLIASVLLCWQAPEWRGWAALIRGSTTLIRAMEPWKSQSRFKGFFAEVFVPSSPELTQVVGLAHCEPLKGSLISLEKAIPFVTGSEELATALRQLLDFVQNLLISPPGFTTQDQFHYLHPFRSWILWLPATFLQVAAPDVRVKIALAHFYAVTLAIQMFFPALGPAYYYPIMRIKAIEELYKALNSLHNSGVGGQETEKALELIMYPCHVAAYFRSNFAVLSSETSSTPGDYQDVDLFTDIDLAAEFDKECHSEEPLNDLGHAI